MLWNYSSHCERCGGLSNAVEITNSLDDAFDKMAKAIYEGMDTDQLYADFYMELSNGFSTQVKDGYKIDFNKASYNSPDLLTRQALVKNCYAFSGAKTISQIQELQDMIINSKGEYKTFSDFRKAAEAINQEYNKNWLKAEYNNAVNSSLSASQWKRYEADEDLYPYLIYQTAGDSNVREEHARLDGIKKPVKDPFWNSYYPPNGWGCRCDANQDSSKRNLTEDDDAYQRAGEAVKNKLFKNNPGKSEIIFTDAHPYFKNVKGKINDMKAVDNYGLDTVEQIYADPNKLSKRLDAFENKEDFEAWWSSNTSVSNKVVINDNHMETKLVADEEFKNKMLSKGGDKWKYGKELSVVIQNPDEVYTLNKTFKNRGTQNQTVYIKYYNDKPIVVIAEVIKAESSISVKSFDELEPVSGKKINDLRRGLLLYKKLK